MMNGEIEQRIVIDTLDMKVRSTDYREGVSEDVIDGERNRRRLDPVNIYTTKKSTAEGMMDISLLTANANQLKFILHYSHESKTFYPALALIILSLIMQVAVGVLLIFRVSAFPFLFVVLCSPCAIQ